jgi:hypothetical protein
VRTLASPSVGGRTSRWMLLDSREGQRQHSGEGRRTCSGGAGPPGSSTSRGAHTANIFFRFHPARRLQSPRKRQAEAAWLLQTRTYGDLRRAKQSKQGTQRNRCKSGKGPCIVLSGANLVVNIRVSVRKQRVATTSAGSDATPAGRPDGFRARLVTHQVISRA